MSYFNIFKRATRILKSYLNPEDNINGYQTNENYTDKSKNTKYDNNSKKTAENDNYKRVYKDDKYYYDILGLKPDSTIDDIKNSYKTLIAQYHPDKVASLGPELQKLAQKKTQDINEAYQYFKKKMNFN